MVENCQQLFSKLTRGNETSVIWHIEGWNCEDKVDFDLLRSNAYCLIQVGSGAEEGAVRGPVSQLRFNFGELQSRQDSHEYNENGDYKTITTHYLSLLVEQVSSRGDPILKYDVKVESLDEKLNSIESINKEILVLKPFKKEMLKNDFIKFQSPMTSRSCSPVMCERPAVLRLKITVTPIFVSAVVQPADADSSNADSEDVEVEEEEGSSLGLGLKTMLAAEVNYADLKLETKDGMTLSAHKVILAARSPFLRELIEKDAKNNDFSGTIKLPDVNAKPMTVIIHWMYTGEFQENARNCIEEVVNTAIQFQLTGLIEILDKEVITMCNPENMFDLFRFAKKNGMPKATEDIAKFIKGNLD